MTSAIVTNWKRYVLTAAILGSGVLTGQAQAKSLVIAMDLAINSIDVHRSWCSACNQVVAALYEGLLALNADGKVIPAIAASWSASTDQTVFTFKIDPKAKFSDGSTVEAKDVKWSFERLKNLKGSASSLAETIASVEAPDPSTVVVKTTGPNSEFLNVVAATYYGIVNSDVATKEGKAVASPGADQTDMAEGWFMSHSAGSGPYILESYESNSEVRLKRNENYWRKKPDVEEVVLRHVKNPVAQAQQLATGQVDIALDIDPETAKTLDGPEVQIDSAPSNNFIYLALSPGAVANPFPLTPDIREAISWAIDRPSLLEVVLNGQGQLVSAPIPLAFPGGSGHSIPEYNPEKSKRMFVKAGHPDGFTLEAAYPVLTIYGVDFTLMMQKIQQDLAKVNVKLNLMPLEFSAWRERINSTGIPLTAVYYSPDFAGTSSYIENFGLAEGSLWAKRAGATRDPSFLLTEPKSLIGEALGASPEDAAKIWFRAGEAIKDAHVIVPLISPNVILAHRKKVKGARYSILSILQLNEISIDD